MNFRVARRGAQSTIDHPGESLGDFYDLAEYLQFDFDPDRVFKLPKSSAVTLSASIGRKSIFVGKRGPIEIDLQSAVDVAHMIARYYWRSQVWAARVAFEVFAILRELCIGNGVHRAADIVDTFAHDRLVGLISNSELGIIEQHSGLFSSRAQMFGSLDERELFKQLATFQIFHELGHLIASRDRARSGKLSSAQEDVEELECDDFGCSELDRAYGSSLGIEFLESIPASIFLSILLWTIAQNFSKLDDFQFRAQTFATLLRRSRAATVHVYRYGHRTEPPSERLEMDALRHFSAFEALIRILDTFFTEAVSRDSEAFYFQGLPSVTEPEARRPLAATAPEDNSPPRAPWELIWAKEDDLAEQRAKRAETLRTAHDHRPRSRPMLSKSNSMP